MPGPQAGIVRVEIASPDWVVYTKPGTTLRVAANVAHIECIVDGKDGGSVICWAEGGAMEVPETLEELLPCLFLSDGEEAPDAP